MQSKCVAYIAQNRLTVTFTGKITRKEIEALYTEARFCVADLRPGFDVISDFSQTEILQLAALPPLRKMIHYMITHKAGEIIRVMPKDRLIYKQMLNLAMRFQGYRPIYVSSIEAATEQLDKAIKRKGLRIYLHECPVEYSIHNQNIEGHIRNISISGCALVPADKALPQGGDVLLTFSLPSSDSRNEQFKIQSKVVRTEKESFAVKFINLSPEREELLWQCLGYESRLEKEQN